MYLSQSLYDYFITGIIGSLICFLFFRKLKNLFISNKNSLWILEITNEEECKKACDALRSHCKDLSALGFSCEWVKTFGKSRPITLLQLATVRGLCCLFHLRKLGPQLPPDLKNILSDNTVIKLGVNPKINGLLLKKSYSVQVSSTLDLRYLYYTKRNLAFLASSLLGVELGKNYQSQNWENTNLTDSEKNYAAKTALVAVEIFKKWLLKNNCDQNNEKKADFNLCVEKNKSEIDKYLDLSFNPKKADKTLIILKNDKILRKSPLYHNCFMYAPDGELLTSCDRRKANWYVDRGLAEVLPGEPFSIKLLFQPAARGGETNEGRFYQQLRQNCCTVCGSDKSYLKHYVVPREYRKYFPEAMKSHQSHDIVLMCLGCHTLSNQHNKKFKQELAEMCNAPISSIRTIHSKTIQKIKNCAKALLYAADVIPEERKSKLRIEIKKFFKVDEITQDVLKKATTLRTVTLNTNYEPHGAVVVNYFKSQEGGLLKLEKLWREHFLMSMKPKHLPALWSVTYNHFSDKLLKNKSNSDIKNEISKQANKASDRLNEIPEDLTDGNEDFDEISKEMNEVDNDANKMLKEINEIHKDIMGMSEEMNELMITVKTSQK